MADIQRADVIGSMTFEELLQKLREHAAERDAFVSACLSETFISDQQLAARWDVHVRTIKRNKDKLPPRYDLVAVNAKRRKLSDIIEFERQSMAGRVAA
jgi:hypothetical protein